MEGEEEKEEGEGERGEGCCGRGLRATDIGCGEFLIASCTCSGVGRYCRKEEGVIQYVSVYTYFTYI